MYNNKRPMTLTRSSFAGTGQFAGHFLGRNKATWSDMYASMIGGSLDIKTASILVFSPRQENVLFHQNIAILLDEGIINALKCSK